MYYLQFITLLSTFLITSVPSTHNQPSLTPPELGFTWSCSLGTYETCHPWQNCHPPTPHPTPWHHMPSPTPVHAATHTCSYPHGNTNTHTPRPPDINQVSSITLTHLPTLTTQSQHLGSTTLAEWKSDGLTSCRSVFNLQPSKWLDTILCPRSIPNLHPNPFQVLYSHNSLVFYPDNSLPFPTLAPGLGREGKAPDTYFQHPLLTPTQRLPIPTHPISTYTLPHPELLIFMSTP